MKQTKIFYNVVLDTDLFLTIYDYLRFHPEACEGHKIHSTNAFDDLTICDWKDLCEDTLDWLEFDQLPKVTKLEADAPAPSSDTWGTLYYQTLNYLSIEEPGTPTLRQRTYEETIIACHKAIEYLKDRYFEMRPLDDRDLENI